MKRNLQRVILVTFISFFSIVLLFAQGGLNDNRVMLQGFYWESYRSGHTQQFPEITKGVANQSKCWYEIVKDKSNEICQGYFDLVWLPPPSAAGGAGYGPSELFNLNNMYGDSVKHRAMLVELWKNGEEPLADIVINHRNGVGSWATFKNPDWGTTTICRYDEAFTNVSSEVFNLPIDQRGNEEEDVSAYDPSLGRAYAYPSFRDIDHTNAVVRKDIIRYLLLLKSYGYRGWRYDMVHGYHARHIADYNNMTHPTFSVGEYAWDNQPAWRGWIWNTSISGSVAGDEWIKTSSSVFDFTTHFLLEKYIGRGCNHNANYQMLYAYGNGLGLMGDNTDQIAWKNKAVTFLENQDTGWRTNEDLTNEKDHDFDSFSDDWQIEQGYAYILSHPGVPCVFWKHYFDWGKDLQNKIKALIVARKVAGVNSGSNIHTQDNAKQKGVYAAMIEGTNGQLYVRIGGDDTNWMPAMSGYKPTIEYAAGNGWKVWIKLKDPAKNTKKQTIPLNHPFTNIPSVLPVSQIQVP